MFNDALSGEEKGLEDSEQPFEYYGQFSGEPDRLGLQSGFGIESNIDTPYQESDEITRTIIKEDESTGEIRNGRHRGVHTGVQQIRASQRINFRVPCRC